MESPRPPFRRYDPRNGRRWPWWGLSGLRGLGFGQSQGVSGGGRDIEFEAEFPPSRQFRSRKVSQPRLRPPNRLHDPFAQALGRGVARFCHAAVGNAARFCMDVVSLDRAASHRDVEHRAVNRPEVTEEGAGVVTGVGAKALGHEEVTEPHAREDRTRGSRSACPFASVV